MTTTYDRDLIIDAYNQKRGFFRARVVSEYNDSGQVSFVIPHGIPVGAFYLGPADDYGAVDIAFTDPNNTAYPTETVRVTPSRGIVLPNNQYDGDLTVTAPYAPNEFNLVSSKNITFDLAIIFDKHLIGNVAANRPDKITDPLDNATCPLAAARTHAWPYAGRRRGMVHIYNDTGDTITYVVDGISLRDAATPRVCQIYPPTGTKSLADQALDGIAINGPGFIAIRIVASRAAGAAAGLKCGLDAYDY